MAQDNHGIDVTMTAGADLSAASNQYKFVKVSADNTVILVSAATDVPFGVLQNKPGSGQAATVRVFGVTKLKAGGTITTGTHFSIGPDNSGQAVAKTVGTDVTNYVVGQPLATAANGDVFTAIIDCIAPGRAVTGN